jgi:hypothetical protein
MPWYAIRSVYHFGVKADGTNVFEERVVSFEAGDWNEAHAKGEQESIEYAESRKFECHPDQMAYMQDGEPQLDAYEVWSELFESRLTLAEFFAERYEKYRYTPDP